MKRKKNIGAAVLINSIYFISFNLLSTQVSFADVVRIAYKLFDSSTGITTIYYYQGNNIWIPKIYNSNGQMIDDGSRSPYTETARQPGIVYLTCPTCSPTMLGNNGHWLFYNGRWGKNPQISGQWLNGSP